MSLRESFTTAVKEAMKGGDKQRLSTVRLIQAALKDKDIEARGAGEGPIPDAAILTLLQKMIKQTQETLDTAEKAGRAELAEGARAEIAILSSFLPRQMDEAELKAAVDAAIAETGAGSVRDMGKVMAALKARHAGSMDVGKAGAVVKAALGG
jgi:uncharacterized protein